MASNPPGKCCAEGHGHEGETTGQNMTIADNIPAYLASPTSPSARKDAAILYMPDIYGICNNSKLVADHFAARGYTTLIPDLFQGDQLDFENRATTDVMAWVNKGKDGQHPHTTEEIDPVVIKGIEALRERGFTKIGAVGYCFGAKYVVRHYKDGINTGFVAHPSFVTDEELAGITGPLSIAAAEVDSIFPAEKRHASEAILVKTGQPWQINLFSGVEHGFAVRGDPKDKRAAFAKDQALAQAVSWFDQFL